MSERDAGATLLLCALLAVSIWAQLPSVKLHSPIRGIGSNNFPGPTTGTTLSQAQSSSLWNLNDQFNYSNMTQLQNAGWALCGSAPMSYYSVSPGDLTLQNDQSVGASVCWNRIPSKLADWTVTTRALWSGGWPGSMQLSVTTVGHTYRWLADGYNLDWTLLRDNIQIFTRPGYYGSGDWHELGIQMLNNVLTIYFDDVSFHSLNDTSNTSLTQIMLSAAWGATDSFSYVRASQIDPNAPDLSVSVSPASQAVIASRNASYTITVRSINGFTGRVNLTSEVSPVFYQGPTVAIYPAAIDVPAGGTANSTLVASTNPYTPLGYNYAIRINATNGANYHIVQATLIVDYPPDGITFTMNIVPSPITTYQTGSGSWPVTNATITLVSYGGYSGWASFSTSIQFAPGPNITITPNVILLPPNGNATATLSVRVPAGSNPMANMVEIWATINSFYQFARIDLRFQPSYFTISGNPIIAYPSSSSTTNVQLQSFNNFSGTVKIEAQIEPIFASWLGVSLTPTTITLKPNASMEVEASITITGTPPSSSYAITIKGEGSWWKATAQLTIYVPPSSYLPGVQSGTWADYQVSIFPAGAGTGLTARVHTIITGIDARNVTYTIDLYINDQLANSTTTWIDVATGENPSPIIPLILIAGNLQTNDPIYLSQKFLQATLQYASVQTFAGTPRSSKGIQSPPGSSSQVTAWWDGKTGFLGSLDATIPLGNQTVSTHYTLIGTNAWTRLSTPPMLSATLRLSATEVTTGVAVGFTAYASGGGLPYSYHWSFGDGQESSNEDPTHTYTRPGNYNVTLTVTDKDGNESTQTTTIRVVNSPLASGIFGIIRMGMIKTIALSIGVVWLLLVVLAVVLFVRTKRRPASQLNSFQTQERSENAPRST